jgi:hypothetical protein
LLGSTLSILFKPHKNHFKTHPNNQFGRLPNWRDGIDFRMQSVPLNVRFLTTSWLMHRQCHSRETKMKMEEKEKQSGQLNLINKESDGWGGFINDVLTLFTTQNEKIFSGEDEMSWRCKMSGWKDQNVCGKSVTSFMNHPHSDFVMKWKQ